MKLFNFKLLKKNTYLRRGILATPHGIIQTPAFVTVGTKGTVKSLKPEDIESVDTQFIFVNTYHLVLSPGLEVLKKVGGIHEYSKIKTPLISDSGGFQVFSLARNNRSGISQDDNPPHIVKISDEGAKFRSPIDGQEFFFTPEFSINAQKIIGADFVVAFDECAPAGSDYEYTKKAMERTQFGSFIGYFYYMWRVVILTYPGSIISC